MTLKLKEHLEIRGYCSYYKQPSSISSDGNLFADKVDNLCNDWSKNCGEFFRHELVKFILTILKRNISPAKL